MGSTALKIAQESQVPVLIVQSAAPFLNWRSTGHKLCVLGAVDARGHSPGVLQWMKKLDTAGPCAFTLVHIEQTHGHVPSPATQNDSAPEPHSTILEHGFQSMARGILGDKADLTTIVKETWESVANELLEISRHAHADLIITGADQWHGIERWLHESVSRSLIKRSGTSLLCLPTSS